MRAEDYGIAGKWARTFLKISLVGLFVVQYAALIANSAHGQAGTVYGRTVPLFLYPVPMILGLVLLRDLGSALSQNSLNTPQYYRCVDWSLLTLIATYACIN